MIRFLLLYCINFLLFFSASSQVTEQKYYYQAFHITSENDNYIWPYHDRYFTNGLHLGYSYLLRSHSFKYNSDIRPPKKTIIHFKLGQDIYTPNDIKQSDMQVFDRPYAGYLYLRTGVSRFWAQKTHLIFAADIGIIGPWAGGAQVQSWWHQLIHYTQPQGWKYQISNEPVLNFLTSFHRSWSVFRWADLITTTGLQVGTAFDNLSQGVMARAGKINTIDNSAIANSRLSHTNIDNSKEWFLFFGTQGTFVWHNSLIDGSLLYGSKSLHTETVAKYQMIRKAGVVYSNPFTTLKITIYLLSPEVVGGKTHQYLGIDLACKF